MLSNCIGLASSSCDSGRSSHQQLRWVCDEEKGFGLVLGFARMEEGSQGETEIGEGGNKSVVGQGNGMGRMASPASRNMGRSFIVSPVGSLKDGFRS